MKRLFLVLSLISILLLVYCAPAPVDLQAEKENIESLLDLFWKSFEEKNIDNLSELIAHDTDMVIFGTDENERWAGWEVCKEALLKQFKSFTHIRVKTHNRVVHVAPTGKTAWFSLLRFISIVTENGIEEGMKTRVTGVLEKRDGKWKLVQYHSSYPITNWEKFKY